MSFETWSDLIARSQTVFEVAQKSQRGSDLRSLVRTLSNISQDVLDFVDGPLKDTDYAYRIRSEFRKENCQLPFNSGTPITIAKDATTYFRILNEVRNKAKADSFTFTRVPNIQYNNTQNMNVHATTVNNPQNIQFNSTAKELVLKIRQEIENSSLPSEDKKKALLGVDNLLSFGGSVLSQLTASGLFELLK